MQHPAIRASLPINVEADELALRQARTKAASELDEIARTQKFNPYGGVIKLKDGQQFRVHRPVPEQRAFEVTQIGVVGRKPVLMLSADTVRSRGL